MGAAQVMRDRLLVRLIVCTLLAVLFGHFALYEFTSKPVHSDFGQAWFAARAVLHGQNPYDLIGPGRAFEWQAPLFYPLPAALVALPFTPFSEGMADSLFIGLGTFVFAWALTEHGFGTLWAFASRCMIQIVEIAQWAPMLAGAYAIAPLSIMLAAKPTVGFAVFAAKPSRWAFIGGGVLILIAFALQPHWVSAWRDGLHVATAAGTRFPYRMPVRFPGGFLVLLGLLRWRRPEARLLVALACVPQTTLPYEGTLLFLIPRGWKQSSFLTFSSWAMVVIVQRYWTPIGLTNIINTYGPKMVLFLYLPCVVMVLRRPNEGEVPAWLERRIAAWPAWLRGGAFADA